MKNIQKHFFVFLIFVSLFFSGCIIDQFNYNMAKSKNTIQSFDAYLQKYPEGEYAEFAKKQKAILEDQRDWAVSEEQNTINAYKEYLVKQPDGFKKEEAEERVKTLRDEVDWKIASETNTIISYQDYIEKHPQGNKVKEAKEYITQLTDERDWGKACSINTVSSYIEYKEKYFLGNHCDEVDAKIEEAILENIKRGNNFSAYRDYLIKFPQGRFSDRVKIEIKKTMVLSRKEIMSLEGRGKNIELATIEKLIFSGADLLNDYASWEDYEKGRQIYNILKRCDTKKLSKAMVNVVTLNINRLRVLFLVVKLGVSGTETELNNLLVEHGDKKMAEDYLNSGSEKLYEGGRRWGSQNGYYISTGFGSHRISWGSF